MYRQKRRRIKRSWDKIPCFSKCAGIVIAGLSNTAVDVFVKLSADFLVRYNLDMFNQWRLYCYIVAEGFPFFGDACFKVDAVSDDWLDGYFGERDEDFAL